MDKGANDRPIEVLLVEDNAADARLVREAFRNNGINSNIRVARDGMEGLAYLRREGEYSGARPVDLMLLDLNMPRKSGFELLREVKGDARLRHIPVVVLTTSGNEADVLKSYELQASCYVTKPFELEQYMAVVKAIKEFWLTIVRLPPQIISAPGIKPA
jgi:chemotaxis family two-component system response regulator Rcp1